jgi:hypothetical protein
MSLTVVSGVLHEEGSREVGILDGIKDVGWKMGVASLWSRKGDCDIHHEC